MKRRERDECVRRERLQQLQGDGGGAACSISSTERTCSVNRTNGKATTVGALILLYVGFLPVAVQRSTRLRSGGSRDGGQLSRRDVRGIVVVGGSERRRPEAR